MIHLYPSWTVFSIHLKDCFLSLFLTLTLSYFSSPSLYLIFFPSRSLFLSFSLSFSTLPSLTILLSLIYFSFYKICYCLQFCSAINNDSIYHIRFSLCNHVLVISCSMSLVFLLKLTNYFYYYWRYNLLMCPGNNTNLYPLVRLQFWSSWENAVSFRCHYSKGPLLPIVFVMGPIS